MRSRAWTGVAANGSAVRLRPAERLDEVVFTSPSVTIAAFRCPPRHPAFQDSGPIQNHVFVFPRRAVRLCHEGGAPFVADPGLTTLYNRGQRYSRAAVSPDGDRCEWFAVRPELLLDAVAQHDPWIRDRPEAPFGRPHAPCGPRTYLAQRTLFEALRTATPLDVLQVEERALALLSDVLASLYTHGTAPRPARCAPGPREIGEPVRRLLAERLGEPLPLAHIAGAVGLSPFQLCRAFRAATGSTLHAYRNRLRLQAALERVASGEDLTRIALELGYSSHSHFTAAFRALFGTTPGAARELLCGRRVSARRASVRSRR